MPQLLALEWNGSEARFVVAASRGEKVTIEQAFSVGLLPRQPGDDAEEVEEVDVGARIASALAARGIGRLDTLVAVGRANIELRQLSLPPAPADELPELVRFQAMREFNELTDDWLLDFVPIGDTAEGAQSVLAAAIDPKLVGQIEQTCRKAHLTPQRLILRPCAAASLAGRSRVVPPGQLVLLVDLLTDEADLTVMTDREVLFLRTARLGGDPLGESGQSDPLLGEIRRTMAAAQNQLGGRRVESIVLCGRGDQHVALAQTIQQKLGISTELFDPFSGLELGRELSGDLPDRPGRFAPLLGMALAELEQTGHAIDFLHPRRRAKPPKRHPKYVVAGVAVAVLVCSFFGYRILQRNWLNDEIKQLGNRSLLLNKEVEAADEAIAAAKAIENWTATDVFWLEEIRKLSEDFPPAKEAKLKQLVAGPGALAGGKVTLEGLAAGVEAINKIVEDLRNDRRKVDRGSNSEDHSTPPYSEHFFSVLRIDPEEE
ncbi:MAG TPA: hypothetical protein VMY42_15880 [Thermoguttaceae bacterium]|nr:hypothetical protein [Thermoguttaceae bacterium]